MPAVTNIAAYQFATLSDLKPLRERLLAYCKARQLKGTILITPEGVNLFVAGQRSHTEELLAELRTIPGLESLQAKFSDSADQPFRRMLVKIKREIISFGIEGIDPVGRPSPKLAPHELKRWLDEGRPVTLYDTRNDYEVKLGTFRNALPAGIDHFRQFPDAVRRLPEEMKHQPIVMFCTGGIRCEKAGPFMENEGFEQIYQLEGGILKYFEECGGEHYDGECFVFDDRVGLDPNLSESPATRCYACQEPLTETDQADPRYIFGISCPFCHRPAEDRTAQAIAERQAAIQQATTPLPGSLLGDNRRPLNVPAECDGLTVIEMLERLLGHIPREAWLQTCAEGRLLKRQSPGKMPGPEPVPAQPEDIVRGGERFLHVQRAICEPAVNAHIQLLHEDEALVVIHKPAPLPMHPSGRFNRNTLQQILTEVYRPYNPRPVHRLDANTEGVVLFARTRNFARQLQAQFESGQIEKRYLAHVNGHPVEDTFTCDLPLSESPGVAGSYQVDPNGRAARTEFQVLDRRPDGTALLEVTPRTGRPNQIRIHLWALGHSIVGDPTYLPERKLGDTQTLDLSAPPMGLFAWWLEFQHPLTDQRVRYAALPPAWATREA
ncbi:MAG: pseudouridine synthase [Planctomycetota bacterium]|nr:MAG: pseudouridine synthase [Planctomycetota bacterium]